MKAGAIVSESVFVQEFRWNTSQQVLTPLIRHRDVPVSCQEHRQYMHVCKYMCT